MTISTLLLVLGILFFHWVADFLLQTQEMATQKSKSNYWLTRHVKDYMFGILPLTYLVIHFGGTLHGAFFWWIINGGLHWITDYATSRWTSKLYTSQKFYTPNKYIKIFNFPAFFSVIGLDQWIHYFCLFTTFCIYTG